VVRFYFDRNGRPSGHSINGREAWFWYGSTIGLFIQFCLAVVLVPLYFFPRAVLRSGLRPGAKLLVIAGVWGTLAVIGISFGAAQKSSAHAAHCDFTADNLPAGYLLPADGGVNCPDGYFPDQACIVTGNSAPGQDTGGCDWSESPHWFSQQ
jgi:hypothetical protein